MVIVWQSYGNNGDDGVMDIVYSSNSAILMILTRNDTTVSQSDPLDNAYSTASRYNDLFQELGYIALGNPRCSLYSDQWLVFLPHIFQNGIHEKRKTMIEDGPPSCKML